MRLMMTLTFGILLCSLANAKNKSAKSVYINPTYTLEVINLLALPEYVWVEDEIYVVKGSTTTFKTYSIYNNGWYVYQTVVGGSGPIRVENATEINYYIPMDIIRTNTNYYQPALWKDDAKAITPFNPSTGTYNLKAWGAEYTVTTPGYGP